MTMTRLHKRWLPALALLAALALPLTVLGAPAPPRVQLGTFLVQQDKGGRSGWLRALLHRGQDLNVSRFAIRRAAHRIDKHLQLPTPLIKSEALSRQYGLEVYLKLENTTPVKSFKIRGALNKVLSLPRSQRRKGVVAASTGNHAQGVAWAARQSGVKATILMPEGASPLKADKTRELGAEVQLAGKAYGESVTLAEELARRSGRTFISGYADKRVIAGQGTIGREILQQLPDVDWVLGAVGGGGLMGGIASAGQGRRNRPLYLGVQSENNSPMFEALRTRPGQPVAPVKHAATLADGTLVTEQPHPKMLSLLRSRLDLVVRVSEKSIERSILSLMRKEGLRIEGAGALPLAGLEQALSDLRRGKVQGVGRPRKVVLVLSGGNIDQAKLDAIQRHEGR